MNKKIIIIALIVGLLIGGGVVFLMNYKGTKDVFSAEEAGKKVLSTINQYMLPPGMTASLIRVDSKKGLHKIMFNIQGEGASDQEEVVYLTKDGALLFPQFVPLDEFIANAEAQKKQVPVQKEPTECEKFQAELTPERKNKIAKCLTEKGYKVYIADWCPFCRQQKELFGEAAKHLISIDCYDPEGGPGNLDNCPDLPGVPAWRDRDGNRLEHNGQTMDGMIQIRILVELSGCELLKDRL